MILISITTCDTIFFQGLFAGIQQLLDNHASGDSTVKTVLLMTDGEANCGLRTSDQIVAVLSNMLEGSGISIHTFGCKFQFASAHT